MKLSTITYLFLLIYTSSLLSQNVKTVLPDTVGINIHNKGFVYNVKKMTDREIVLDGILDESDWQKAYRAKDFLLVTPVDTGFPQQPSEVLITYNDDALYMAIVFYDTIPGKRVAESFRRDFAFNNNDNFLSIFDTFRDQTNAFSFGMSASGAIWDGLMSNQGMNLDWDSKMELKLKNYPDKWITEMKIPFKTIRYSKNSRVWYANFGRLDIKTNEKSAWAPVPRQFPHSSPAYTGILLFDNPLPKQKMNFSLIPYISGGYNKDYEAGENAGYRKDFGMDVKIGINTAMNLDLTYNPDFAQVEVDQQQMNIDRFELLFPEKRQFFLENRDLFADYGEDNVRPFFSRRIGLDAPVLAGARLSGKLGKSFRLGFMNMTTEKVETQPVRNYTVLSMQKKVFSRSSLAFMFVNKEYSGSNNFNRVAAFDYNMASNDNVWTGKLYYHRSFQPRNPDKQFAEGVALTYSKRNILIKFRQTAVGKNFLAETGYIRRRNYISFKPELSYFFVPNNKIIQHGPYIKYEDFYSHDFNKLDHQLDVGYQSEFSNRTTVAGGIKNYKVILTENFDPTHVSNVYLSQGSTYNYNNFYGTLTTNNKKPLNGTLLYSKGGFFNGNMDMVDLKMNYRFQPYVNLSMNVIYTNLRLPSPFLQQEFWLVGPKLDLTFSQKVYLTTFVQYNEQLNNTNLNIRFQWRYKPVSDLFIVYTDNSFAENRHIRNRALVLKLTYWWN